MASPPPDIGRVRSFEALARLIARNRIDLPGGPADDPAARPMEPPLNLPEGLSDRELFLAAMADVKPFTDRPRVGRRPVRPCRPEPPGTDPDADPESLARLHALIADGHGFVVSQTAEYIEGTAPAVHPRLSRQLHAGRFAIQAHVNLHGLTVARAWGAFDAFLRAAVHHGHRAVLVVHGRGRCSPAEPVLKGKVQQWLARGPWRRWVLAWASARPCDGGAGATYVLLRTGTGKIPLPPQDDLVVTPSAARPGTPSPGAPGTAER